MTERTLDWQDSLPEVLVSILGPSKGNAAAELWQRQFSRRPGSSVIGFVREAAETLALDTRTRHELRTAIYRAQLNYTPAEAGPRIDLASARKVASALLLGMRQQLAGDGRLPSRIIFELGERLAEAPLMSAAAPECLGWLAQGGELPNLTADQLGNFVHTTYVAICRCEGPVRGDHILRHALETAEALPEARDFPPRRLL